MSNTAWKGGEDRTDCEKQEGGSGAATRDTRILNVLKVRKMEVFFHERVSGFDNRWHAPIILEFSSVMSAMLYFEGCGAGLEPHQGSRARGAVHSQP